MDSVFLILECIDSEDLVPYGSSALHVLYNYLFGYFCLYLLTLENLCNYIFFCYAVIDSSPCQWDNI